MEPVEFMYVEFIYNGDYDMSHMVDAFCRQLNSSFSPNKGEDRKFHAGNVYTLTETAPGDWYEWGFVKTINGQFGSQGPIVYTGICITQEHADEVLLYINGPEFIKIK